MSHLPAEIYNQVLVNHEYFAAIIFSKPRSPVWPIVKSLCMQADCFSEFQGIFAVAFRFSPDAMKLLNMINDIVCTWKTALFYVNGKKVYSIHQVRWFQCYWQASACTDWKSYCHTVFEEKDYSSSMSIKIELLTQPTIKTPELIVANDKYLLPCRKVYFKSELYKDHPSNIKDIFHAEAVSGGYHECPLFDLNYFKKLE